MGEISNIDAIVELIMREARSMDDLPFSIRIYLVLGNVNREISALLTTVRKAEVEFVMKEKQAELDKGM